MKNKYICLITLIPIVLVAGNVIFILSLTINNMSETDVNNFYDSFPIFFVSFLITYLIVIGLSIYYLSDKMEYQKRDKKQWKTLNH